MSLVAWYKLDGNANDSTVNPANGSVSGVTYTTGKIGQAGNFNGSANINLGNPSKLQILGNQSISMWLYPTDFSLRRNPYNKAYGGEGTITQETNGVLNYYYGISGANTSPYQIIGSGTSLTLNSWNHVVLVRDLDNLTAKWYINGVNTTTVSASYSSAVASGGNVIIGDGYTSPYLGYIDDVRIYNHALSLKEVLELNKAKVLHYNFNTDVQPTENIYGSCSKSFAQSTTFPVDPPVKAYTGGNWGDLSWSGDVQAPGTFNDGDVITFSGYFMVYSSNISITGPGGDARLGIQAWSSRGSEGVVIGNCVFNKWYYFEHTIEFDSTASSVRIEDRGYDYYNTTEAPYTTGYWCNVQVEKTYRATKYIETSRSENVIDVTDNDFDGIVTDTICPTWSEDSSLGSGSYLFRGNASKYIYVSNEMKIYDTLTWACWVKQVSRTSQSSGSSTTRQFILSQGRDVSPYGVNIVCSNGTIQAWYGGSTIISGPTIDDQWHHIAFTYNSASGAKIYVDGVQEATGAATTLDYTNSEDAFVVGKMAHRYDTYTDRYFPFNGYINDVRTYSSELSSSDIQELYRQRASLDNSGKFSSREIQETGHQPLIVDYTTWTIGTGAETGFNQNGDFAENVRITDQDPWSRDTIIWSAVPNGDDNADGGWNTTPAFTIDNTKMYRFSTWVWRNLNGTGKGNFYLGLRGYGTTDGVYSRGSGSLTTNPYFVVSNNVPEAGRWELVVGHVWPTGSGTGDSYKDSGRYTITDGKVGTANDFVWHPDTTTSLHRSYLYYCTDPSVRQYWVYPRVDILDGSEPSIEDLLAGFDSNYYNYIDDKGATSYINLDIGSTNTKLGRLSEIGFTEKLVAWYPLQGPYTPTGDAYELVNRNDGTITGDPSILTRGYDFAVSTEKIEGLDISDVTDVSTNAISFSAWINRTESNNSYNMFMGQSLPFFAFRSVNNIMFSAEIEGSQETVTTTETFSNDVWYHTVFTYDGLNMRIYVNSELKATSPNYPGKMTHRTSYLFTIGDGRNGSDWYPFIGKVSDVRIYDKVLSTEDIEVLYNTTNPDSSTMSKVSKGIFYTKSQIIEN